MSRVKVWIGLPGEQRRAIFVEPSQIVPLLNRIDWSMQALNFNERCTVGERVIAPGASVVLSWGRNFGFWTTDGVGFDLLIYTSYKVFGFIPLVEEWRAIELIAKDRVLKLLEEYLETDSNQLSKWAANTVELDRSYKVDRQANS
jgi:hypothetical protein